MTFTDEKPAEKQEETKAIVVAEPESKIMSDPKLRVQRGDLVDMLSYCRPHNSKTERQFIARFIVPLGVKFDKKGNAHKIIGDVPVIWSSHTDTVHNKKGMQKIVYWMEKDITFFGSEGSNASCLGADDTAGVWIMINMIKAKIPGHYIFHRGEECGGIGSKWLAEHGKDWIKGIKFAIAFDRKDTDSIITYQGSKKTCSDEFAKLLAEQIGMDHKPDNTGMWTDTASYVDDIDECTNVSVGYYNAHGKTEKLNVDYLFKLKDAMCKIDVTKFVATRKPGDNSYKYQNYRSYSSDGWTDDYNGYHGGGWTREIDRPVGGFTSIELDKKYGYNCWHQWFGYEGKSGYWTPLKSVIPPNPEKWRKKHKKDYTNAGVTKGWLQTQQELFNTNIDLREMKELIQQNPDLIADLLDGQGYGPLELRDYIKVNGGFLPEDMPGY